MARCGTWEEQSLDEEFREKRKLLTDRFQAESFLYLSRVIEHEVASTACLINSAVIFARLGDYATASHILDDAMPVGELLALTLFITAHVEIQLGEWQKAEDCFTVAVSAMEAPVHDYRRFGLTFALQRFQIQNDLNMLWQGDFEVSILPALPAECIFEAPDRYFNTPAQSSKRSSSLDSARFPALSEGGSSPPHSPASPIIRSIKYSQDALTWHGEEYDEEVLPVQSSETKYAISLPTEDAVSPVPYRKPSAIKVLGSLRRKLSTRTSTSSPAKPVDTKTTQKALLPRDPRRQDESINELAGFITDLPRTDQMAPRGIESECGNVDELLDFFRLGPEPQPIAMEQRYAPGSASSSLYSCDQSADSIRSSHLAWESTSRPPSPPYRYRPDELGLYLTQGPEAGLPSSSPPPLERELEVISHFPYTTSQQPHDDSTNENLHSPEADPSNKPSWPSTTEAPSLPTSEDSNNKNNIPPPTNLTAIEEPQIPSRKSSLLRTKFSLHRPSSSSRASRRSSKKPAAAAAVPSPPTPSVPTNKKSPNKTIGQFTKAVLEFGAF